MDDILAISWRIATNPSLYRELASNPYSPHALQVISEKFSDANPKDVIKAIILAEPEGRYDLDFKKLDLALDRDIKTRLLAYCKKHKKELRRLSDDFVYDILSTLIFETADVLEIEQKYSQKQRQDFKLAIIAFIENRHKTTPMTRLPISAIFALFSIILLFIVAQELREIRIQNQAKNQVLAVEAQNRNQSSPVHLKIPSINVDTVIENVGIAANGEMDTPKVISNVGWFAFGVVPGQTGNAVIDGHFDGGEGESAVFNNLDKLKAGDKIYVTNNQQGVVAFVVQGAKEFNPGYESEVFVAHDGGAHLNLITCDGVWKANEKSYTKRLVVFADLSN